MKKNVIVIGSTGLIGKAVTNQLKMDGYKVTAMSRDTEKVKGIFGNDVQTVEADVLNTESLKKACYGMDCIYISLPEQIVPQAMPNIIAAAKATGVKHIAYTSGCTVCKENAWHPMINAHHQGETLLKECGIDYTIFRLTMVMDMIPRYANNGKPFIIGKQPHQWSWIYSGDFAKMVSKAFSTYEARNKSLTVFGTEKATISEAVDRYNKVFHKEAKKATPKPYWLANAIALFVGSKLKYAISIFKYFEDHVEEGNPDETYKIFGYPEMDIDNYLTVCKTQLA